MIDLMLPSGPIALRALSCLDIKDSDVRRASELVGETLHSLERQPEETRSGSSAQILSANTFAESLPDEVPGKL